ncbi:MAG: hypothetical protein MIJ71_06565, partial [Cutibacterium acnes]
SIAPACEDAGDDVGVFLPELKSFMGSFQDSVVGLRSQKARSQGSVMHVIRMYSLGGHRGCSSRC